ncbi:hypothetical protein MAM1_0128c06049 [Mucor ambiguus]|uniref:Uncharacterized protein n=1 Tax=Mucor ambiguus TaxID=91626 RepID=A0A0C9MGW7_9FUNG|nr:hypothetical protein MAM1_0128c06049 [Mucor ambiguus]
MTKSNTTTPSLTIRLKLNTIQMDDTVKVQKSSPSPKSKSKKKAHSKKRRAKSTKAQDKQIDGKYNSSPSALPISSSVLLVVVSDKIIAPANDTNKSFYWTSERVESTKLILRTVVMAN